MQANSHPQFYDYCIYPTKLSDLIQGWKISIRQGFQIEESKSNPAIYIPIFGLKGSGKSWILSKLQGMKDIPHGIDNPTQGLCVKYSSDNPNVCPTVYIDTEPASKFLTTSQLDVNSKNYPNDLENLKLDHQYAEKLTHAFLTKIANMLVLVVNELTFETQFLLDELLRSVPNKQTMNIIVIHNLQNYQTISQVDKKLKEELIPGLKLEESQCGYISNSSREILHFILAKEGSEAGDHYNSETIEFLQKKFNIASPTKTDLLGDFHSFLKKNLEIYYEHPEVEKLSLSGTKIFIDSSLKGDVRRPPFAPLNRVETNTSTSKAFINEEDKTLTIQVLIPGEIEFEKVKMKHEVYLDKYRIHMRIPRKIKENVGLELFNTFESESELVEIVTPFISATQYNLVDFKDKKIKSENGYFFATWKYREGNEDWE